MHQFCCQKDEAVQYFLRHKAEEFERIHKSRTYLIVDDDELEKGNIKLLAYFSLGLKVLTVSEGTSNRTRALLDGLSAKRRGKQISNFPVFLIGQLAKNDGYKDRINGREILSFAVDIIREAHKSVSGRLVLVECRDNEKLIDFYSSAGFDIIGKDSEDDSVQMISYL